MSGVGGTEAREREIRERDNRLRAIGHVELQGLFMRAFLTDLAARRTIALGSERRGKKRELGRKRARFFNSRYPAKSEKQDPK